MADEINNNLEPAEKAAPEPVPEPSSKENTEANEAPAPKLPAETPAVEEEIPEGETNKASEAEEAKVETKIDSVVEPQTDEVASAPPPPAQPTEPAPLEPAKTTIKAPPAKNIASAPLPPPAESAPPEPAPPEPAKTTTKASSTEKIARPATTVVSFWDKLKELRAQANQKRSQRARKNEEKIMAYAREHNRITNDEVEKITGVKDSQAQRYLNKLVKKGKLIRFGKTSNTFYKPTSR